MRETAAPPITPDPAALASPTPTEAAPTAVTEQAPGQQELEHRYYQYLRSHQYATTDALLNVLRWYLPYFDGFRRVLDIGCGHGEFLRLLQESGHEAVGIDIDPAMVETCRRQGLTAYEGDASAWLATQEQQFDAIFSSNVIEHLDAQSVQLLIRQAHGALRPGGMLLIGTPNPESLIVQFHEFWRDPTHVRLYGRQLIEFFFADAGLHDIHNGNNTEAAWDGIEIMLAPIEQAEALSPNKAMPGLERTSSPLQPLPAPPPAAAPLRRRLAFRLLHFVYQKFLEPYIALIRIDQERHYQQLQLLQDQILELQQNNLLLKGALHDRVVQLGNGFRFMHPPRELFVYGYKGTTEGNTAEGTAAMPVQPTSAPQE